MAFNALVLPIVLAFLLILANDPKVLGKRVNSPLGNIIALTVSLVCVGLGLWYGVLTLAGQTG
jgi:Mn2+/Fe2+ NRAMP family transporter